MSNLDTKPKLFYPLRFFIVVSDEVYETLRTGLDVAHGYPSEIARTSVVPIGEARRDDNGRPVLSVLHSTLASPNVALGAATLAAGGSAADIREALDQQAESGVEVLWPSVETSIALLIENGVIIENTDAADNAKAIAELPLENKALKIAWESAADWNEETNRPFGVEPTYHIIPRPWTPSSTWPIREVE